MHISLKTRPDVMAGEKKETKEIKADLQLLLECIKCQFDNPAAIKQALLTVASICTGNKSAQDHLRESGGLQFILNFLTSTVATNLRQAALYLLGCAVEKNAYSQKQLSTCSVFTYLCEVLSKDDTHQLKQTAVFFILNLVANNSLGQMLIRKSSCLEILLDIFKSSFVHHEPSESGDWLENIDTGSMQLWTSVTSALCVCVNNPQNDENQQLCSIVFPQAFKFLEQCSQPNIVRPIACFIGLAVANNIHNQGRVEKCGGIQILIHALNKIITRMKSKSDFLQVAVSVSNALDAIISENVKNARVSGQMGAIPALLELFECSKVDHAIKLQVAITLGHCTDGCEENQLELVQHGGMGILIRELAESEDKELIKAVKYIFQSCVNVHTDTSLASTVKTYNRQTETDRRKQNALALIKFHQADYAAVKKKLNELERKLAEESPLDRMFRTSNGIKTQITMEKDNAEKQEAKVLCSQLEKEKADFEKQLNTAKTVQQELGCEKDKLQQELKKEKTLRQQLESEVAEVRQEAIEKQKQEKETMEKAAALLSELERQHQEQAQNTQLAQQVCAVQLQKGELNEQRKQKEAEVKDIEQRLKRLEELLARDPCHFSPEKETGELCDQVIYKEDVQNNFPKHARVLDVEDSVVHNKLLSSDQMIADPNKICSKKTCSSCQETPHQHPGDGNGLSAVVIPSSEKSLESQPVHKSPPTDVVQHLAAAISLLAGSKTECSTMTPRQDNFDNKSGFSNDKVHTYKNMTVTPCHGDGEFASTRHNTNITDCKVSQPLEHNISENKFAKPVSVPKRSRTRTSVRRQASKLYEGCNSVSATGNNSQAFSKDCMRWLHSSQSGTPRSYPLQYLPPVCPGTPLQATSHGCSRIPRSPSVASEFDLVLLKVSTKEGVDVSQSTHHGLGALQSCVREEISQSSPKSFMSSQNTSSLTCARGSCVSSPCSTVTSSHTVYSGRRSHRFNKMSWTQENSFSGQDDSEGIDAFEELQHCKMMSQTASSNRKRQSNKGNKCPGCLPPATVAGPLLNSRTFNIALETSHHACGLHRQLRKMERSGIVKAKSQNICKFYGGIRRKRSLQKMIASGRDRHREEECKAGKHVYDFTSSSSSTETLTVKRVTPPSSSSASGSCTVTTGCDKKTRRPRVPYTAQEIQNLKIGVLKLGKFWNQILSTYNFHPSRTAIDLKDKYKQMMQKSCMKKEVKMDRQPFSMCEERRLSRGVRCHGYNWKTILSAYKFAKGRTAKELRNKWRTMHRN